MEKGTTVAIERDQGIGPFFAHYCHSGKLKIIVVLGQKQASTHHPEASSTRDFSERKRDSIGQYFRVYREKYSVMPASTFETATEPKIKPITRLTILAPLFPIKR